MTNIFITQAARRLPGLRRLPIMRLLALGEIALLAHEHIEKLTPYERRRLVELVRLGHGRPSHLPQEQQDELALLIAKTEPRLFAGLAADKLSPVRLPRRVVRGPRRRSKSQ